LITCTYCVGEGVCGIGSVVADAVAGIAEVVGDKVAVATFGLQLLSRKAMRSKLQKSRKDLNRNIL
jgi:hypothetical protein